VEKKSSIAVIIAILALSFGGILSGGDDDMDAGAQFKGTSMLDAALEDIDEDDIDKTTLVKNFTKAFPELLQEIEKQDKAVSDDDEREEIVDYLTDELWEFIEYQEMREEEPKDYAQWLAYKKKDYKSVVLGSQIRRQRKSNDATPTELKKKETELSKLLQEVLVLRLKEEEREIKELESELKVLKALHKKRLDNKDRIIKKRIDDLTGANEDDDDLDW